MLVSEFILSVCGLCGGTGSGVSEERGCWEMIIVTRIGAGLLMGCGSQDNLGRGGDGVHYAAQESGGVTGRLQLFIYKLSIN